MWNSYDRSSAPVLFVAAGVLIAAGMFVPDERTRLFLFGVVIAGAFAWAVYRNPNARPLIAAGVLLLRWLPPGDVVLWREAVVLAGALCFESVPAALIIALVTPIYPARMLLFPFVIALLMRLRMPLLFALVFGLSALFVRYSIATVLAGAAIAFLVVAIEKTPLRIPVYACLIALFALAPWSGIVARGLPALLRAEPASPRETPVWVALEAGRSVLIDAPPGTHYAVITASGANAAGLRAGRVMGRVEAGGIRRVVTIGDIADFGFMRPQHFFASRNPPPGVPLDDVHGYGIGAWLHTAGRMAIASAADIRALRITAASDLPPGVKLQIEAVEFE